MTDASEPIPVTSVREATLCHHCEILADECAVEWIDALETGLTVEEVSRRWR